MMPDFLELYFSRQWPLYLDYKKCILLWSKVVVTGCGHLWSVFVMSLEVLAINASIGNSKLQWINGSMED